MGRKRTGRKAEWEAAAVKARQALDRLTTKRDELQEEMERELWPALEDLRSAQESYEEWQGNLPESLANSATASKLEEVTSIDIPDEPGLDNLDEVDTAVSEAESADLPQGFGRD